MSDLDLIKELREKTGAGFLDCKNTLKENNNNIEESIDSLRKKGLAKASKKSSREAKEGAVGFFSNDKISIILKINSETDFSAKSDIFLDFLDLIGKIALKQNDKSLNLENFLNIKYNDKSVSDLLKEMIAKIGENLIINDLKIFSNKELNVNFYIHNPYRKNIGKIVSAVFFYSDTKNEEITTFSKNICMHIAASKPEAMDIDQLSSTVIENEKKIQQEMIQDSGKPSNVMEKILKGKMKKYYSEVTLLNQNFVIDPDKTIKEAINDFNSLNKFDLKSYALISL
ncbi:MAG: translation elongation factor Ts [Pelagibacteraceae bacterium]|jgi:elongation factor Ts|nr:translation elongation factor Ts [Pelagibacteraceae bacterium]MBT4951207.1 translation elongation factor Ts [Pelagibacteraceae bacterium]MBT6354155.1 translation elongation factor Ts [Pelagibacteraceae bacterium]